MTYTMTIILVDWITLEFANKVIKNCAICVVICLIKSN